MTKNNSFMFVWDCNGLESIVDLSPYVQLDQENVMQILKGQNPQWNPLNGIIFAALMRAQLNSHRAYHIYAIDCDASLDEQFWRKQWDTNQKSVCELIMERGHRLY